MRYREIHVMRYFFVDKSLRGHFSNKQKIGECLFQISGLHGFLFRQQAVNIKTNEHTYIRANIGTPTGNLI